MKDKRPLIVSLSGKDSTAMLLHLLENDEAVTGAVMFDTGWEFPVMGDHIRLVETRTDVPVYILRSSVSFDDYFSRLPIRATKDYPDEQIKKGQVRRCGYGWPSWIRRWCTDLKTRTIDTFLKQRFPGAVQCIGFANDEQKRTQSKRQVSMQSKGLVRYPLIEAKISSADCLSRCKAACYNWGGLYERFSRVSCFCCPLQSRAELHVLYEHFPALWARLLEMDAHRPAHNKGFQRERSVLSLDQEFRKYSQRQSDAQ